MTNMRRIRILTIISIITGAICILATLDGFILFYYDRYHLLPWGNREYETILGICFLILPMIISFYTGIKAFILSSKLIPIPKLITRLICLVSPCMALYVLVSLPGLLPLSLSTIKELKKSNMESEINYLKKGIKSLPGKERGEYLKKWCERTFPAAPSHNYPIIVVTHITEKCKTDMTVEEQERFIEEIETWCLSNIDYIFYHKGFFIDEEAKAAGIPTGEYRKTHPWPKEEKK